MKNFILNVIILLFLFIITGKAQVVFEPINSEVYTFLDRIASEHIISLNDEVKPFSRMAIGKWLNEIKSKSNLLNDVQMKELIFYEEEFAHEMNNSDERWFLYKYSDTLFNFRVSPFAGYGVSTTGDESGHSRWWGLSTYGTLSDWFGASFSYKDIGQYGGNVDDKKDFTPERGYYINAHPKDGIEFSDVTGAMNINWKWGDVSLLKDNIQWGHGKFGQLIFSDKVESYPQLRLYLNPAKWIRFYYMHGWLNSLVIDSSSTYYSHFESKAPVIHQQYISKFVAANLLSITPIEYFDVSIGNSVIYSGNLRPEMFIPFLYYKVMDHNTGRGDVDDANGQIFFDISSRNLLNYQFYSTLFIDGFSITKTLNSNYKNNELGYTFGVKRVNLFLDNLDLTIEYSRLNPFVYEHKYQTEDYKTINYYLGHWLGQNADQVKLQLDYKPIRSLDISCSIEKLRKGGLADINVEYSYSSSYSYMDGPHRRDYDFRLEGKWEPYHEMFMDVYYNYSSITDEQAGRTAAFLLGEKNSFGITLSYGL